MRLMEFERGWISFTSRKVMGLATIYAIVIATVGLSCVAETSAAEPYGEVTRFGGAVGEFATTGTIPSDNEGKFVTPVGFAVESAENPKTKETNTVYVLDRTLSTPETGQLDYRLQEISSVTHKVLGTASIAESFKETETASDAHPLVGLAVDSAQKRIYTIVESMVQPESGGEYAPVAGKLEAWSTEPNSSKELEPAAGGFPEDPSTKASVIADEATLKATSGHEEVLYAPQGLASNKANGEIAIEAQHGVSGGSKPFTPGNTLIQLVHTESGEGLGQRWIESEPVQNEKEWMASGLFAGEEAESFGVDLFTTREARPHLALVKMSGTPAASEIAPFTSSAAGDFDEAPATDLEHLPFGAPNPSNVRALNSNLTAGSPTVQVGDNEYAALFARTGAGGLDLDRQDAAPWEQAYSFWMPGSVGNTSYLSNMGIRVFEGDGKVIDTIGGGTPNSGIATGSSVLGSCNIDFVDATLAAGAAGTIFVLTQPREGIYDDEVIEFAPGGKAGACPSVREGNVEVQEGSSWKELKGEPASVSVDEGVPTKFSAMSLDQPRKSLTWSFTTYNFEWPLVYEWTPFGFEWNLEGQGYSVVNKMEEANGYAWPTPEVEHTYNTPGIYNASVRLYGDYGTKVVPFVVHVLGSTPPEAAFAVPGSVIAGTAVTFDGSGSKPTPGAEIEYYEWNFGEGPIITTEEKIEHTFPSAGKYKVTLVIRDKQGAVQTSSAAEHEVTVEAAQTITTTASSSQTTSTQTTTHTTTSATSSGSGGAVKGLTLHQKLEKALKACHRDKSKKKRKSCEKAAHKRYAPKRRAKKASKK